MIFITAFVEIYLKVFLHVLLFAGMILSFGFSLDPYAPPEQNLAFLILSSLPIWYWIWAYLTRNDEIKFWQIF